VKLGPSPHYEIQIEVEYKVLRRICGAKREEVT
jgi:hypothetical protein